MPGAGPGDQGAPRVRPVAPHYVPVRCSGRTGTRVRASPVAWRMADTTAGVEDRVGASPAPRSP